MIETIPLDYFINFLVGSLFALSGWNSIRKEKKFILNPYFKRALIFGAFVFLPIGYYLAIFYRDWSWMYFVENSSPAFTFLVVTGYILSLLLGYLISGFLIKVDGGALSFVPAGIGLLGILFFSTVYYKRLLFIGTYREYYTYSAKPVLSHPWFLISMTVIMLYFFIPLIYLLSRNMRESGTPFPLTFKDPSVLQ